MKKSIRTVCIFLFLIFFIFLVFIAIYTKNIFINSKKELTDLIENVAFNQSMVEIAIQERCDYIPRLIEETRKYIDSGEELLELNELSVQIADCIDSGRFIDAEKYNSKLTKKLDELYWMYPVLHTSEQLLEFRKKFAEIDKEIDTEIGKYNISAKLFNTKLMEFPANIVSKILGYSQMRYFEAY